MTPFSKQCDILAKIYVVYKREEGFVDFTDLYNVGFPLAFLVKEKIVPDPTDEAMDYIFATWDALMEWLELEDTGFDSLEEILEASPLVEMS